MVLAALGLGSTDASGRQSEASHRITVGIRPIVAFAVQNADMNLAPGSTGSASFAVTSNLDDTRLVASLDAPLPAGLTLSIRAQTDLAHGAEFVELQGNARAVVLDGMTRGVRSGQPLLLELAGQWSGGASLHRLLTVGIEHPETGTVSQQVVSLAISASGATP